MMGDATQGEVGGYIGRNMTTTYAYVCWSQLGGLFFPFEQVGGMG